MRGYAAFAVTILNISLLTILCTHRHAQAEMRYMDNKLIINGFVKETAYIRTTMTSREKEFHDTAVDYLTTSALVEALYTAKESEDLTIRLFGGLKWWWEKSPLIDDNLRRHIPHRDRKDYMHPRSFDDDILTEAYVDIIKGPWQFRIGKQIVIWGQLDIARVADVVNPLDLRKGVPGVDTWEEVKRGIWMIRGFYQSQLPGNLLFEFIFNPGDFRQIEIPYEGTHYGAPYHQTNPFQPGPDFGIFHWLSQKWRRDAPTWNLKKNYEWGFRIRGYTWDIDWTLLLWNGRDDGPVADPRRITPFTLLYIQAGLRSQLRGKTINPPDWPDYKVWYYKRYTTVGGTAQTWVQKLWSTVWRLEWFMEIARPLNKATNGASDAVYGWTKRNILGVALQCSKRINIPRFTQSRFATGSQLDISVTYFWEKIFNHDHDLVTADRNHAWTDSTTDQIIMFVQQPLFNQSFMFIFTGNYYLRVGKWMAVPSISYIFPGVHWRFDLGYAAFGGAKRSGRYSSRVSSTKDSIILRLRYEF